MDFFPFYQDYLQNALSTSKFLLLRILVWLLQVHKQVRIERLAAYLASWGDGGGGEVGEVGEVAEEPEQNYKEVLIIGFGITTASEPFKSCLIQN